MLPEKVILAIFKKRRGGVPEIEYPPWIIYSIVELPNVWAGCKVNPEPVGLLKTVVEKMLQPKKNLVFLIT